ncbi:MAG: hypothetical protein FWD47_07965 [Treponema sp.]|nr:hypothetical protein [Treponema sp.]
MRKISLKVLLPAFLGFTLLFVCACVDPLTVADFLKDEDTQAIIENVTEGTILLHEDNRPGGNLTRVTVHYGNTRMRHVPTGRYYILEIGPTFPASTANFRYVTENGTASTAVNIGKLSGTEITGLVNNQTYRLTHAASFAAGSLNYSYSSNENTPGTPIPGTVNANGVITIPNSTLGYTFLHLGTSYAEMVRVGNTTPITPIPGNIIRLDSPNTTTDYIFYNNLDIVDGIAVNFRFLTVVRQALNTLTINISSFTTADTPPEPNAATITFSQLDIYANNANAKRNITIDNSGVFNAGSIRWRYNNAEIGSGASFNLDLTAPYSYTHGLNAIGTHIITIEATTGSGSNIKYYSATIEVVVNP